MKVSPWKITVIYRSLHSFKVRLSSSIDQPTIENLSQHVYNLQGDQCPRAKSILNVILQLRQKQGWQSSILVIILGFDELLRVEGIGCQELRECNLLKARQE